MVFYDRLPSPPTMNLAKREVLQHLCNVLRKDSGVTLARPGGGKLGSGRSPTMHSNGYNFRDQRDEPKEGSKGIGYASHWSSIRRHGQADVLANKARDYIQALLAADNR